MVSALGQAFNALGMPGIVRTTDYASKAFGTRVQVRCGRFFTVVSVNGIDVYFERLTGRIDGVGSSPKSDRKSGAAPELAHLAVLRDSQPETTQNQTP